MIKGVKMDNITVGRIVYYVYGGIHRAAIVTYVWSETCVNLHVFKDGTWPDIPETPTSVMYGNNEGNWHLPEI